MPDSFNDWNAKDGFHAVRVHFGSLLTVSCIHYINGEPATDLAAAKFGTVPLVELFEKHDPSSIDQGAAVRLERVTAAIARYFTTGGRWEELGEAVKMMRKVIPGGTEFPGYHLVDSYEDVEGNNQHVYAKDGENEERTAILWEQPTPNEAGGMVGGFVDRTTLEALVEQEEEHGWGTREAEEDAGEGGRTDQVQLPARRRPVTESDAE